MFLRSSLVRPHAGHDTAPRIATALLAAALAGGCGRAAQPEPTPAAGPAQDAVAVAADTRVLEQAVGAANEVIRNAPDCDTARQFITSARSVFDDVEPRLRTGAARTSLANLRKQVDRVAELCP